MSIGNIIVIVLLAVGGLLGIGLLLVALLGDLPHDENHRGRA